MYHFTLDLKSQLRKYYGFKIHQVLNLPVLSMPLLPHVMSSHAGAGQSHSLAGIAKEGHHSAVFAKALVRAA